jgi:hypothetical protein
MTQYFVVGKLKAYYTPGPIGSLAKQTWRDWSGFSLFRLPAMLPRNNSEAGGQADNGSPKIGTLSLSQTRAEADNAARPRSTPIPAFHGTKLKAFLEDVYVWSSELRETVPTTAAVDTQSDRNLIYVGFLNGDLRVQYKRYEVSEARPLHTLNGPVAILGFIMLKIFALRVNKHTQQPERQRPQYLMFDVTETNRFGDMLLGSEYAEGSDSVHVLVSGSRKATPRMSSFGRLRGAN